MEWKTVSTLLFRWQRGVWVFEQCVCVCLNACQEREGRKEKEANGWGQAEPRSAPLPPPHPFVFWRTAQAAPALYRWLCRLFRPFSSPGPALSREAPLPLTAHPPQTHRSVCASCSQSQSRSRSYVCRCPWCRCKWSQSEWWRRRTLRRRPGKDQITGLRLYIATAVLMLNAIISMLTCSKRQR